MSLASAKAPSTASPRAPAPLIDRHGRPHTYLRLSVTSACDLKCTYCTPDEGIPLPARRVLNREALVRIARVATDMGVDRIRLTGGEPLLRRDLVQIVRDLRAIPGLRRIGMTTNGQRLTREVATRLRAAGLDGVNVSVDSIDPARYERLTRGGDLERAFFAIAAALAAGLHVKVNVVALKDLTEREARALIERWAIDQPIEVRFLEMMPLSGTAWSREEFLSLAGQRQALVQHYALCPLDRDGGVAERFGRPDWRGSVGFIRSLSEPFCGTCSRLRVTAWGHLRPCLFSPEGIDLAPALDESDDGGLRRLFAEATEAKSAGHGLSEQTWGKHAAQRLTWIRHTGG